MKLYDKNKSFSTVEAAEGETEADVTAFCRITFDHCFDKVERDDVIMRNSEYIDTLFRFVYLCVAFRLLCGILYPEAFPPLYKLVIHDHGSIMLFFKYIIFHKFLWHYVIHHIQSRWGTSVYRHPFMC